MVAAEATVRIIIMTVLSFMLKLFDLNNDVRKTSMMFEKKNNFNDMAENAFTFATFGSFG